MTEFLALITSFPTVFFTFLLTICVVYWLFVMLGALDLDVIDLDIEAEGSLAALFSAIGVGGVPVTVVVSFLALWGWVFSALISANVLVLVPFDALHWPAGGAALLGSVALATLFTRWSARPLRPLFVQQGSARSNRDLVGQVCEISSDSVDADWGEARVAVDGTVLVVSVRTAGGKTLLHGERALIFDYDPDQGVYLVEGGDTVLATL